MTKTVNFIKPSSNLTQRIIKNKYVRHTDETAAVQVRDCKLVVVFRGIVEVAREFDTHEEAVAFASIHETSPKNPALGRCVNKAFEALRKNPDYESGVDVPLPNEEVEPVIEPMKTVETAQAVVSELTAQAVVEEAVVEEAVVEEVEPVQADSIEKIEEVVEESGGVIVTFIKNLNALTTDATLGKDEKKFVKAIKKSYINVYQHVSSLKGANRPNWKALVAAVHRNDVDTIEKATPAIEYMIDKYGQMGTAVAADQIVPVEVYDKKGKLI